MFKTEFILTSLVVILMPGTGVIYTVSTGLFLGRKAGIAAAFGCTCGILPHLLAGILGLSAVLHAGALVFQVVKFAGAVYLLYFAWSMWRDTGALRLEASKRETGMYSIAVRGFLINILNPKLSIFFLAFLPLFVSSTAAAPTLQMLYLSAAFMAMTLVVFILYGLLADAVRKYVIHSPRVLVGMKRCFAMTFAALGAKLALTET